MSTNVKPCVLKNTCGHCKGLGRKTVGALDRAHFVFRPSSGKTYLAFPDGFTEQIAIGEFLPRPEEDRLYSSEQCPKCLGIGRVQ